VDVREPEHVARAIARLDLQYVVMTMVDRDDLLDGGAEHVARTVRRLRELRPDILIEALVGDFHGHLDAVDTVAAAAPDVFAHNVETVRRVTRTVRDARCSYDQSLTVLKRARERALREGAGDAALGVRLTKSSIMVGVGETDDEVLETMADLRQAGVDVVTIGQYLRPTPKHHEVLRYVEPATFAAWEREALGMGFLHAASGPLVRSSYRAAEVFLRSLLRPEGAAGHDPAWVEATLRERMDEAREAARRVSAMLESPVASPSAGTRQSGISPSGLGEALLPAGSLVRRA
jgi:lipoic acid synthetase